MIINKYVISKKYTNFPGGETHKSYVVPGYSLKTKRRLRNIFCCVMFGVFLLSVLTACEFTETSEEKVDDLDYTVCDESRLPHELINEKKKEPFKFTYRTKDYLYIVVGYGAQDRMDLNVVIKDLYLTENAIFVETELTTKEISKLDNGLVSYPWIAVKCELYDVQVNFK